MPAMDGNQKSLPKPSVRSARSWLGLWWISWFGIIGGFLLVGVREYRCQSTEASHFSLILMVVTIGAWLTFFIAEEKIRKKMDGEQNAIAVVNALTLMGTFLAIFTLLGIGFFVAIAPQLR